MLWNKKEFQFKVLLTLYHSSFSMYKFNFMSIPNPDSLWIYSSDQPSSRSLSIVWGPNTNSAGQLYNPRWVDINNGLLCIKSLLHAGEFEWEDQHITHANRSQNNGSHCGYIVVTCDKLHSKHCYTSLVLGLRNNTPERMLCCKFNESTAIYKYIITRFHILIFLFLTFLFILVQRNDPTISTSIFMTFRFSFNWCSQNKFYNRTLVVEVGGWRGGIRGNCSNF